MKELRLKDGEIYEITEKEFKKVIQAVNNQNSVYIERVELLVNPFHIAKVSTPQALLGKEILMDSSGQLSCFDGERVLILDRYNGEKKWISFVNYDWELFLRNEAERRGRKLDKREEREAKRMYTEWIKNQFIPADQYLEKRYDKTKQLKPGIYGEEEIGNSRIDVSPSKTS